MTPCLTGRLEDFILPQVIALLEAVRSTGELEVEGPEGVGCLGIFEGNVVSARLERRRGELAAYLVLSWSTGEFRFSRDGAQPSLELSRSSQALCLEAMRLLDESRNPGVSFAPVRGAQVQGLSESLEIVWGALVAGSATVRDAAQKCGMSTVEAYYHLEELERLGAATRTAAGQLPVARDSNREGTIRVLVVDDSELMRRALTRIFESDPGVRVVATAASGEEALALLPTTKPDVISLDLHMPGMDGVTTLKRIMLTDPTPTVIVTASSPDALDLTFESILRFGAIDFITKPSRSRGEFGQQERYILQRLRKAAQVNLRGVRLFQPRPKISRRRASSGSCSALMVSIAGTGSCLSYMQLLTELPADLPIGILGVLPFPEDFLHAFVAYMDKYSAFELRIASEGARLASGVCYLTTGTKPIRIVDEGQGPTLLSRDVYGPCDPNVLLYDAGQTLGEHAIALVLSSEDQNIGGGLGAIREAGGMTMAQLPETCVDSEGPLAALSEGLIDKVVVLNRISSDLSQFFMDRLHRVGGVGSATEGDQSWPRRSA